ncbi:MAG: STAS domain-containing protein [Bacteroidaceae bacterium]|nr:STAS domain-containing protein [Bacteroidaceae bacterium]
MQTTIQNQDGKIVVFLEGRLDTAAAPETEQALKPLYDSTEAEITLDCTKLVYISSSGLRLFLSLLKAAKAKGGHVYIHGINEDLRKIFQLTGFINLFEFN